MTGRGWHLVDEEGPRQGWPAPGWAICPPCNSACHVVGRGTVAWYQSQLSRCCSISSYTWAVSCLDSISASRDRACSARTGKRKLSAGTSTVTRAAGFASQKSSARGSANARIFANSKILPVCALSHCSSDFDSLSAPGARSLRAEFVGLDSQRCYLLFRRSHDCYDAIVRRRRLRARLVSS